MFFDAENSNNKFERSFIARRFLLFINIEAVQNGELYVK